MNPRITSKLLIAAALTMTVTAACGTGNEPKVTQAKDTTTTTAASEEAPTTAAPTTAPVVDPEDTAKAYLTAIGTDSPDRMAAALGLAAPDSPAHLYAAHQIDSAKAKRDQGNASPGATVTTSSAGNVKLCYETFASSSCATFGGFVASETGQLIDFTVEGLPINDRLLRPNGQEATGNGATIKVLSGYKSVVPEYYSVAVEIRAGSEPISPSGLNSATYIGPDGRQVSTTYEGSDIPTDDLQAGGSIVAVVSFLGTGPGGTLDFELYDPGYNHKAPFSLTA